MHRAILFPMALALAASAASAGTLSESVPFDFDPFQGTTELVLNGFDSLGGTRQLTGTTFRFDHHFALDLFIESTGPTPVAAEDFSISLAYISIYQLGTIDDGKGEGGSPPFFGPGAFFIDNHSADLAAYDGLPGNDGPDSFRATFTDAYTNVIAFGPEEPAVLDALTDTGPLTTIYGGFGELGFFWNNDPNWPLPGGFFPEYPNDAAIWVDIQGFRHSGAITITYEYAEVPSPASAAPLALMALATQRRRRPRRNEPRARASG